MKLNREITGFSGVGESNPALFSSQDATRLSNKALSDEKFLVRVLIHQCHNGSENSVTVMINNRMMKPFTWDLVNPKKSLIQYLNRNINTTVTLKCNFFSWCRVCKANFSRSRPGLSLFIMILNYRQLIFVSISVTDRVYFCTQQ